MLVHIFSLSTVRRKMVGISAHIFGNGTSELLTPDSCVWRMYMNPQFYVTDFRVTHRVSIPKSPHGFFFFWIQNLLLYVFLFVRLRDPYTLGLLLLFVLSRKWCEEPSLESIRYPYGEHNCRRSGVTRRYRHVNETGDRCYNMKGP